MNFQSTDSHSNLLFKSNYILKLEDKILTNNILFINKSFSSLLPLIFKSWFTFCSDVHNCQTVSSTTGKMFKPSYRTDSYGKSQSLLVIVICNSAVPLVLALLCRNCPLIYAFYVFLYFKDVVGLFTKIYFLFVLYLLCLYGP